MLTNRPSDIKLEDWTITVTELIKLTQKHKLLWREDDFRFEGFDVPIYTTEFLSNVLRFGRRLPQDSIFTLQNALSGFTATVYQLVIFGPNGGVLTACPPIAALNGLAIAIEAQADRQENNFFEAIHRAAEEVS